MRVKIGHKWYDANDEPIMIEITVGERKQIFEMAEGATKYCQFPTGMDPELIKEWMNNE